MNKTALTFTFVLAAAVGFSAPAHAMSPSESYLAYRTALAGAETMDDLKSHLDSAKFSEIQTLSAEDQKKDLEIMKLFIIDITTQLEIVSETIDGDTATLETKYCSEGNKATSKVDLVLQEGNWKLLDEKSHSGLEKC
jgi:hypothetical protein